MSQRLIDFLSRHDIWAVAAALAGFLTLTWVIRGAPIGQSTAREPDESPGSGYRDRVVASAVVGFLLVLAGAYLAATAGIPWSIPAFAAGFGIVLTVLRFNTKYRHVSPTLRRVVQFSSTALTASLLAGILVVVNVAAFKYGGRAIDLTRDQAFSLSSQSTNLLKSLDRPVSFTVFFGNSEGSSRQLDRVRQLLDLYRGANSSRVRVDYLNPYLDAKEFEALVKRVPAMVASPGDGILVAYGEGADARTVVIGTRELFEGPASKFERGPDRFVSSFQGEDVLTSAIIRLREGKRSRVAFTVGHGEPPTSEIEPAQPGIGLWRARLASTGIDAIEVDLNKGDFPDDISLVVIVAPRTPFRPDEVERIRQLIVRGGQFLVLLNNAEPTGLEDLLRTYNVAIGTGQVVDPRYKYMGRASLFFAPIPPRSTHPIVAPFQGRAALLRDACPLTILAGRGSGEPKMTPNPGVIAETILSSGPDSWSESDLKARPVTRDKAKDPAGPFPLGVAASTRPATESEKPKPRLVVFSSPNLADNGIIQADPTNLDLLMNAVFWLKGRPELIGIDAKTHESVIFAADPGLQLRLVMVPTFMAIVAILGMGATTYLARRD